MADDRLLDKIRKLLALAERAGPGEAEAAMAAVRRLMTRHKITEQQLDADPESDWIEAEQWERSRTPFEMDAVAELLQEFFFVRIMTRVERGDGTSRRRTVLFGRRADVDIALYVGTFLLRAFRHLWSSYRRRTRCPTKHAKSYYLGVYSGLSRKLRAENARADHVQKAGLIRVEREIDIAFSDLYGNLSKGRGPSMPTEGASAIHAGRRDGAAISIRPGLKPESPVLALPAPTR